MNAFPLKPLLAGTCLLAMTTSLPAILLAHYDFNDGDLLDNEVGASYTLTHEANGSGAVTLNHNGSASFPGLEGGNEAYLETEFVGGKPKWTVSFWWKTDSFAQGNSQGLFSNKETTDSYSWQLDSYGLIMRLVSAGNPTLTYAESNLAIDTWYHTVIRKIDNSTQVYITEEGAMTPSLVMNQNKNPGGLFDLRLGVNRSSNNLFQMDMANVKVYDDSKVNSAVNLGALLAEGPQLPESGHTLPLLGLALGGLLFGIRRK